ncbi:hypothetical protein C8R47DRAFT_1320645, partial [Mycena vitilis]
MTPLRALGVLLALASVHTQTLYYVSENAPGGLALSEAESLVISAAGTNAQGATTYVEVAVVSSELLIEPSTTRTLLSAPTTFTQTLVADASGFTLVAQNVVESCGLGGIGAGTCVEKVARQSETLTFTYSGSVVPFHTLAATTSAASSGVRAFGFWSLVPVVVLLGGFYSLA